MRHTPRSRFVTAFLAVCDPATGRLVYVNAGQNPPIVRTTDGAISWLQPTGMALGLSRRATFVEQEVQLGSGDLLVANPSISTAWGTTAEITQKVFGDGDTLRLRVTPTLVR